MSVGNLPPHASVLIKITYVAELQVDGEKIYFDLPGTVAPWKKDTALSQVTQVKLVPLVNNTYKISVQFVLGIQFC